jgi:hypothetical protein
MPDETRKYEFPEVLTARDYIAQSLARATEELGSGAFVETQASKYGSARNDLSKRDTLEALSEIAGFDLEDFDAKVLKTKGRVADTHVLLERTTPEGKFVQVSYEGPSVAVTDERVTRSVDVFIRDGGQTQEVPDRVLSIVNLEWRESDVRLLSLVKYTTNDFPDGAEKTRNFADMKTSEVSFVNSSAVEVGRELDYAEIEESESAEQRRKEHDDAMWRRWDKEAQTGVADESDDFEGWSLAAPQPRDEKVDDDPSDTLYKGTGQFART